MSARPPLDRRALQREYRQTRRPMGVFRVCNKQSNRWYIGASVDVPAMLNRQRFQLEMGSHPNPALQRDWKRLGADAFVFETLDLLAPPDDPAYDPRADLRTLEALWRERLAALYGNGYHDETTSAPWIRSGHAVEPRDDSRPNPRAPEVDVDPAIRSALQGQFLAALDMLERAVRACPAPLWGDATREPQFWYVVHHTLFWTDCYLAESAQDYRPPAPFGLEELDPAGVMPPRTYAREELLPWLAHCRERAIASIGALTEEQAQRPAGFPHQGLNRIELLLDNLRHVQHHTAQLQLLLRQAGLEPPRWVAMHRDEAGTA